jgi:polysaccharide transporter, PST family
VTVPISRRSPTGDASSPEGRPGGLGPLSVSGASSGGVGSLRGPARSALGWNGLAAGVGLVMQLAQLAYVARALPPSEFGAMAAASLFFWFGQGLADLGLGVALVQTASVSRSTQKAAYGITFAGACLVALALGGLAMGLGGSVFAGLAAVQTATPWRPLLLGLLPCLPLMALTVVAQAGMQRELRFGALGQADAAAAIAGAFGAIVGLRFFHDARALVAAQAANAATRCLLSLLGTPWKCGMSLEWSSIRSLYPFGAYQLAERVLNFFVGHLDKLVLARWLGGVALGLYTVGYQLALRPLGLIGPVSQRSLTPLFSRLQHESDRLRSAFLLSTRLLAHAVAPLHLWGAALATPILRLMLGPQWEGVVPVFQALCLWGFLATVGQPAGSLLPAIGRAEASLKLNGVAVLTYALCAYLGSALGPTGVAWGMVAGTALVLVPVDAYLRWRATGIGLFEWVRAVLPALAMASVSGLVAAMVARFVLAPTEAGDPAWAGMPISRVWLALLAGLLAAAAVEGALQFAFARAIWREAWSLFRGEGRMDGG